MLTWGASASPISEQCTYYQNRNPLGIEIERLAERRIRAPSGIDKVHMVKMEQRSWGNRADTERSRSPTLRLGPLLLLAGVVLETRAQASMTDYGQPP